MQKISLLTLLFFISLGCQQETERSMPPTHNNMNDQEEHNQANEITKAICVLHPTEGNKVTGTITFTKEGDNVKVVADIQNLTPGNHGFHIHQYGDCSAPDGSSAGDHFNPEGVDHGARTDSVRHTGDFGNIEADENGNVHAEFTDSFISFSGQNSIIGKAVIVHEKADDLKSQPSGNAGSRLACGVIGVSK